MSEWIALGLIALAAGIVDAVMGGGGMLQLPALFALFPDVAPAALLGTAKLAALAGTSGAALQYAQARAPQRSTLVPAVLAAFVASLLGAYAISQVPGGPLRKALPFLLLALLAITARGDLGLRHAPRFGKAHEGALAAAGTGAIGFYDGFFGPGAGVFYKVWFVRALGFDFLNAAAPAKFANVASNVAALAVFAAQGLVLWKVAIFMAACNFVGGQIGSRIALRFGNRFIRWAFVATVCVLIARTFAAAYLS